MYLQNYGIFPKPPKLPSFRTPDPVSVHRTKHHLSVKTLAANWCVNHPAACLSCFLFDLWKEIGSATNAWPSTKRMVTRMVGAQGAHQARSQRRTISIYWDRENVSRIILFCSHAPSIVSYIIYCLAKVVGQLPFCIFNTTVKRLDVLLPFPLTAENRNGVENSR